MNVAFIPVRGGSKSIPLKNIKEICGKPLVYWTITAAEECKYIDKIYVATDSDIIKNVVVKFGFKKLEVIDRSKETATDTASTESAMLEFANKYDFDNIVLIQATSPLLTFKDLDNGFELYNENGVDSVLSAVRQKRFNWTIDSKPINYDFMKRPRRQEFEGYYTENGAFYITSKERLLKYKNRLSGNIKISEMPDDSFFEIDEPSDWVIIEDLMKKRGLDKNKFEVPEIKMFLTDCDGCLTDGGMYYSENGDELKKFNTRDGVAFRLMREKGILVGIITGENMKLNDRRAKKLNLDILIQGCNNKKQAIEDLSKNYKIPFENIVYVGDDIADIEAMKIVGFSVCPSDACNRVKEEADIILKRKGGEGVIREIGNLLFKNV